MTMPAARLFDMHMCVAPAPPPATPLPLSRSLAPLAVAAALWAGAIATGGYLGAYQAEGATRPSALLAAVVPAWARCESSRPEGPPPTTATTFPVNLPISFAPLVQVSWTGFTSG